MAMATFIFFGISTLFSPMFFSAQLQRMQRLQVCQSRENAEVACAGMFA